MELACRTTNPVDLFFAGKVFWHVRKFFLKYPKSKPNQDTLLAQHVKSDVCSMLVQGFNGNVHPECHKETR
jgi:hypothetical protein